MTKLFPILLCSILLSAEMEVDGNLKVTGTVESITIDSLKAVIADLQAQLAALQEQMETIQASNNWETRMYTISINLNTYSIHEIDMFDLTGYDLNGAVISYFTSDNITITDYDNPYATLFLENNWISSSGSEEWNTYEVLVFTTGGMHQLTGHKIYYYGDNIVRFRTYQRTLSGDISLLVTAQFPN